MLATIRMATVLLIGGVLVRSAIGAAPTSLHPLPAESELVARVQAVLPTGWAIQRTESQRVPPGWFSAQADAIVVTISDGRQEWTLSFVPLDWIGIQFEATRHPAPDSPNAVSQAESYKLLHGWGRQMEWTWLRGLGNSSASLVNGGFGWQRFYGDRLRAVEAEAARLMRAHCRGARQRSDAAASLVRLGVPAVTVFREIAVDGVSYGRETVISALGELKLPGSMPSLRTVLRDPDSDYDTDLARKHAVYLSFDHKADGIWPMDARIWVDGILVSPPPPVNFLVGGRLPSIEPGTVVVFVFEVSRHLPAGAVCRVSGSWRGVPANEITVTSSADKSVQSRAESAP